MGGVGSGRLTGTMREARVDEIAKLNEWAETENDSMKLRSNVVLLLLGGMSVKNVADRLGVNQKTIYQWRGRWNSRGLQGLYTRQRRVEENDGGVNVSLKRQIESLESTDIGHRELKGLVLQFIRDVRRDKADSEDHTGSKLQLEGLKLLERVVTHDDGDDGEELPDFMK